MRLLTIPHSSYCEVARWALQAAGVAFTEEVTPLPPAPLSNPNRNPTPVLLQCWFLGAELGHAPFVTATRQLEPHDAPRRAPRESSVPVGQLEGLLEEANAARRDTTMVPLAIEGTDGSTLLGDSFEICQFAAARSGGALAPGDPSWARKLDFFGAACRNLCYCFTFADDLDEEARILLNAHFYFVVGDDALFQRKLAFFREAGYAQFAGGERFRGLWEGSRAGINAAELRSKVLALIDELFGMVAEKLESQRQPFLGGASPGVDDIMFAGHASWLLFPPEFGAGTCTRWPTLEMLSPSFRRLVDSRWRDTPGGRLISRLYSEHRDLGLGVVDIEPTDAKRFPGVAQSAL